MAGNGPQPGDTVLDIRNLTMYYRTQKGFVRALENVSLRVTAGDAVGLVGESGCGKTSLGMAILKLLPPNAEIRGGQILFQGEDLVLKDEEAMRRFRWRRISMIFQAAMNALNPVYRVGDQIAEAIRTHDQELPPARAKERVKELFRLVGMNPARADHYPHEYSGGMRQRAIIAMALALDPTVIIADEPTTALDVIVQDQIIKEIMRLQGQLGMTMLYISHDIAVVAETCNRIGVMYAGSMVEYADTRDLFRQALHPYTQGLMASYPSLTGPVKRLRPIPGEPPNLLDPPTGCRFHPRCPLADAVCRRQVPEFREIRPGHFAACHLATPAGTPPIPTNGGAGT